MEPRPTPERVYLRPRGAAPTRDADLVHRMRVAARRYRELHPLADPEWTAGSYPLTGTFMGRPDAKTLTWFPSLGCTWSRKGGCTMCNFGSAGNEVDPAEAHHHYRMHLELLDPGLRRIHVAPGGSFFSDVEVPDDLRTSVLTSLDRFPFLEAVGIETRPNLLSYKKLHHVVRDLPETVRHLTLGFGLECRDDFVRELAVSKGYGTDAVARAREFIDQVNRAQTRVRVDFELYVLLKPILLGEGEAIEESVRTLRWAFDAGAGAAVLFANTTKENTLQDYLAERIDLEYPMRYRTPYYRSAVEVLFRLPDRLKRRTIALGLQSGIMAEGMPRGCDLCTPFMVGSLMAHGFNPDGAIIRAAQASTCPCKVQWQAELDTPDQPLHDRVEVVLSALEKEFVAP